MYSRQGRASAACDGGGTVTTSALPALGRFVSCRRRYRRRLAHVPCCFGQSRFDEPRQFQNLAHLLIVIPTISHVLINETQKYRFGGFTYSFRAMT